jgi:hypothetical protein
VLSSLMLCRPAALWHMLGRAWADGACVRQGEKATRATKSLRRVFTRVDGSWMGRVQIELRGTEGGEDVEDGGQGSDHGIFTYRRKYLPTRQVRANLESDLVRRY